MIDVGEPSRQWVNHPGCLSKQAEQALGNMPTFSISPRSPFQFLLPASCLAFLASLGDELQPVRRSKPFLYQQKATRTLLLLQPFLLSSLMFSNLWRGATGTLFKAKHSTVIVLSILIDCGSLRYPPYTAERSFHDKS